MLFSILLMTLFFVIISSLAMLTIGEIRQATQVEDSSSAYMAYCSFLIFTYPLKNILSPELVEATGAAIVPIFFANSNS